MTSCESDEDLVEYGTPLEPLEEDEIPRKRPCLIEEQVVKDKQGRRRFHGAFTGGFSAGFFNTVGSLEGWKPSSFKSSKCEKGKFLQQTPKDFMDEEDLDEFGIAPLVLKAKESYLNEDNKKRILHVSQGVSLESSALKNFLKPVRETIGIKLLKKMGWKPGQGVGPRLSGKEKKKASKMREKIYGCQLPRNSAEDRVESDSDSDSEWANITFAPDDYEPFLCKPKDNFFGIGYQGLDRRSVLGSFCQHEHKVEEKRKISGQAFGVGAFEDEDEDIYAKDDMSEYDFSIDTSHNKEKSTHEKSMQSSDILDGFVTETKSPFKKIHPLPELPRNFKPQPQLIVSSFNSQLFLTKNTKEPSQRQEMSFRHREILLRDNNNEERDKKSTESLIANVKINLSSFKPFSVNPDKQIRYEKYLKLVEIGKQDCLKDLQPLTMTEWDRDREKVEFEQASKLFKPLSGIMGDRFLTASQPDNMSDPLAVVEKFHHGNAEQRNAAKMKMFGPLTRKTEEWTPCHLLCKRFNVPDPSGSEIQIKKEAKKVVKSSFFDCLDLDRLQEERKMENPVMKVTTSRQTPERENVQKENVPVEQNAIGSINKIDVFKEIFLASDDEEEEEATKEKKPSEKEGEETELLFEEKIMNNKRNDSLPSGIFENIDLDSLNGHRRTLERKDKDSRRTSETKESNNRNAAVGAPVTEIDDSALNLIYGPKLPDKLVSETAKRITEKVMDGSDWVEKKLLGKKHRKKSKKKKSHKSKHKHKKKKKS